MFDYKTFDDILNSMLSGITGVRTDEGSLVYNACCKLAEKQAEVYDDMDIILENILPDTMDLTHLIRLGAIQNVFYNVALPATVTIDVTNTNITFELDTPIVLADYTFKCTNIDNTEYTFDCIEEGVITASDSDIETSLEEVLSGYTSGTDYTWTFENGSEDEDEEAYRQRVIDSYTTYAQNGNKQFYRELFGAEPHVAQVKPFRSTSTDGTFNVYLIKDNGTFTDDELTQLVKDVEEDIPLGQYPTLKNAGINTINVKFTAIFNSYPPIDEESLKLEFTNKFNDFCEKWKEEWGTKTQYSMVRLYDVEQMILNIAGVDDVSDVTLNGNENSIMIALTDYPKLGTLTVTMSSLS